MAKRLDQQRELGDFLRARRAELTPERLGLQVSGNRRRVPGLRREEVADLASISPDYYTRLEQGRLPTASSSALNAIAKALNMDPDQQRYLRQLARKGDDSSPNESDAPVRPATRVLLDNLTETPAMVLGRHMDILAWNQLASAMFGDFSRVPVERRNWVLLTFLDPDVRRMYSSWSTTARNCVSLLRMEAAANPSDPHLEKLVAELSDKDKDFARWWSSRHVVAQTAGTKSYRHEKVGEVVLDWQMLTLSDASNQSILVMTAEPGSPSQRALQELTCLSGQVAADI